MRRDADALDCDGVLVRVVRTGDSVDIEGVASGMEERGQVYGQVAAKMELAARFEVLAIQLEAQALRPYVFSRDP